jgi:hypothetical protein
MSSRREQKERARAERLQREAERRAAQRRKRRRVSLAAAGAALALLAGAVAVAAPGGAGHGGASHGGAVSAAPSGTLAPLASLWTLRPTGPLGPTGPEGVPVPDAVSLAGGEPAGAGSPVDGIQCQGSEQVLFHIHAHLTVFVDGTARRIPYGIGIPGAQASPTPAGPYVGAGSCFYWLHTHAADGIIHIESPVARTYTLGDLFDVWREKLGPAEVGPAYGPVTAFYDGRLFRANPRDIPLTRHAQIQLDVGRPLVAPAEISFPQSL